MKRTNPFALLIAWLGLAASSAQTLHAADVNGTGAGPQTGIVTGYVSNAATRSYLEGAKVSAQGAKQAVFTDRLGRYQIALPRGSETLIVTYTGLDSKNVLVSVTAGQTSSQDIELTSEIYALEKFTVSGVREGNAMAIMRQKQAPNVKNIVSSDAFGNMAAGNIGDFLQRLPGITGVTVGNEVRAVQIRGIDPSLNSVTMDGNRLAASQSAGLGRRFEFEQASLGLIETIEVTKAPTPDMDADSIGGNVNLITKSAFDRAVKRYFAYSIGGTYAMRYPLKSKDPIREPIEGIGPSLSLTYADRLGKDERIGIKLIGSYHVQDGGEVYATQTYEGKLDEPYFSPNITSPYFAGATRSRLALGGKVDYKVSSNTIATLNLAYNWFHEDNDSRSRSLNAAANVASFAPGYSGNLVEILPLATSSSTLQGNTNDKSGRTYQLSPSVKHRLPGLDLDYGLSFSNSETYYDHSPYNRHHAAHPKGTVSMVLPNVGWKIDRTKSREYPLITQTAGPDIYDLSNYRNMILTQGDRGGADTVMSGRLDLKKNFETTAPAFVKVGGNVRRQERTVWNNARRYNYAGPDGVINSGDEMLGQFVDRELEKYSDGYLGYRPQPWPGTKGVTNHILANPGLWTEDLLYARNSNLGGNRTIKETVMSSYIMGNVQINDLSILGGVRVEKTETDAQGPLQVAGVYTGRQSATGEYRKIFPGLHFKYMPAGGLVARASYSTSVGRPGFGGIIPLDQINDVSRSINRSNPGLKPQFANNFDLSAEYYFEPVGLLSVSLFLKEITDFQFTDSSVLVPIGADNGYNGEYANYRVSTPRNGGNARYRGIEFAYQQQFRFLPGLWRNFGVNINYTYLQTQGNYGGSVATDKLAGFVPRIANIGLDYIQSRWSFRLSAVWRGDHLSGINANAALLRYQRPRTQVDLKTKYNLSSRLGFFCDLENLTRAEENWEYYGNESRPGTVNRLAPKVVAGLQGTF
jgi:iron complex outermembrane receptor protein